jgi:hypothetical protein
LSENFRHQILVKVITRSAQNRLATIRLPYAGPTTGLKSAKCRHYERRLLADFRPVVGPAYGSRMVANQIRADRVKSSFTNITKIWWQNFNPISKY